MNTTKYAELILEKPVRGRMRINIYIDKLATSCHKSIDFEGKTWVKGRHSQVGFSQHNHVKFNFFKTNILVSKISLHKFITGVCKLQYIDAYTIPFQLI